MGLTSCGRVTITGIVAHQEAPRNGTAAQQTKQQTKQQAPGKFLHPGNANA
jgi:hypothetical protein